MTRGGATTVACRERAPGATPVVLIHGVGFGPETLEPVAVVLERQTTVIVAPRRGYGERADLPPAGTVAEHVADLLDVLDRHGVEEAVLAGVSGGATVTLATALAHPERVHLAIAHEPAVGSISPELLAVIRASLGEGGERLVRTLAGEQTWERLAPATVAVLMRSIPLIEADAAAFVEFEPTLPPPGVRVPLVCSLGDRSSPTRREVARRLSQRTGAPIAVVPDCGHLAQFDAPAAFAELILSHADITQPERNQQ